jgi:hypothetical protein
VGAYGGAGARDRRSGGGAYGGAGGSSSAGARGAGGAGTASLILTGQFGVTATANANGGDGARAGTASAIATGQGASGNANAKAVSGSITTGSLVTAASANADTPVAGKSTALTWAAIGNGAVSAPALVTADQAVAQITSEPKSTDVNTINTNNAAINTAFHNGKTPTYFGIGELGGAYSPSASGSETETSSVHMPVDLTKFSPLHDLIIGFYSGTAAGNVATDPAFDLSLDVKINGTDHISNFTTVAAANAFFRNDAQDYGALSGTSLQLDISLSITESGGGYDFGLLIGDPPPASDAAAHHNMVAAMAAFGAGGGEWSGKFKADPNDDHRNMLAPHWA